MSNRKEDRAILSLGYDNFVMAERIVAVQPSTSLPSKRLREQAEKENRLLDATAGRKTRAIVVTDSGHVILSSFTPLKITQRLNPNGPQKNDAHAKRCELEWKEGEFAS